LHDVVIAQDIHIYGDLEAYVTSIDGNLFLNGAAILIDSTVKGKVDVNGSLKAVETTLTEVEASTDEITLTNSSIICIKLRKPVVADQVQKVILSGTVVSGDIVFEKEGGEVILRNKSSVQGNIIGGLIVIE
jgi:cytoskeletal protein CcmA (bactofilin family)